MNDDGALAAAAPAAALPKAGEETVSRGRTISEADLVSFAALTGDWHPQHADAKWAARGQFGERVAHGMMVLSYAVGLIVLDPERVVALRALEDVTFKRPVRIGETIRVRSQVESVEALDAGLALVTLTWRVINQNERVVARARVVVLWRAGAQAEPDGEPDLYREGLLL